MTSESEIPERVIEREILDDLPSGDPRALRARRDLERVNFWMGHAAIFTRNLRKFCERPPRRIVEIGAGDGTLLLKIARQFPAWKNVHATLIDQEPAVSAATLEKFRSLGWKVEIVQADVLAGIDSQPPSDLLLANLFLHHFSPGQLAIMFSKISEQTKLFIACEPRRTNFAPVARRLLWLIGCSALTRHDAEVSIRAGFLGAELSPLWPLAKQWEISESKAGLFSHLFLARRREA
jgi:hypothetical protein